MTSEKKKPSRKKSSSPFAQNLKQILDARGISLRKAANICDVEPSVLHGWLQGTSPQDIQKVLKLCNELKCDFQWLLTGTKDKITAKQVSLTELFEMENDPMFSGIFMIEAKRLKRKV